MAEEKPASADSEAPATESADDSEEDDTDTAGPLKIAVDVNEAPADAS